MMETKDYMLEKYYGGETDHREEATLRRILATDKSADGRLMRALGEIYDMAAPDEIKPVRRRFSGWSVWISAVAAAIAVIATVGAWLLPGSDVEPDMAVTASCGGQGSGARIVTDPDEAMTIFAGAMAMAQSRIDAANLTAFKTVDRISMNVNASIENQISSIPNFR